MRRGFFVDEFWFNHRGHWGARAKSPLLAKNARNGAPGGGLFCWGILVLTTEGTGELRGSQNPHPSRKERG